MPLTTAAKNSLIDHFLCKTQWDLPGSGTTYVCLSTNTDGIVAAGTGAVEPQWTDYAGIEMGTADWSAASSRDIAPAADLTWAAVDETDSIQSIFLATAATGGTPYWYYNMDSDVAYESGQDVVIPVANWSIDWASSGTNVIKMPDALVNEYLDHIVGRAESTKLSSMFTALSTADPGTSGSAMAEPSGGGYARVEVTGATWDAASGGSAANASEIDFGTASGAWGTITHVAFFTAATDGTYLGSVALQSSKSVVSGTAFSLAAGDVTVSI